MAYQFYLGRTLLPVPPEKLKMKIKNANQTYTLINEGEINVLKSPGLTEIEFDVCLPNVQHSYARYKDGFQKADYFLGQLRELKAGKKPFQFIVTRELPDGSPLFGTNMKVSLEEYSISEDAGDGFDVTVGVELKLYRPYGTKVCNIVFTDPKPRAAVVPAREAGNAPSAGSYTVKKGDCLWNIAKKYYGSGSKYTEIFSANQEQISNPNLIYPGQVLTIPSG